MEMLPNGEVTPLVDTPQECSSEELVAPSSGARESTIASSGTGTPFGHSLRKTNTMAFHHARRSALTQTADMPKISSSLRCRLSAEHSDQHGTGKVVSGHWRSASSGSPSAAAAALATALADTALNAQPFTFGVTPGHDAPDENEHDRAGPVAEAAEAPGDAAANVGSQGLGTFGLIARAFRPAAASAPAPVKPTVEPGGFARSAAVVQAAVNVAHRVAAAAHHRLSLKVMCGAGAMCLYHCGGHVSGRTTHAGTDDKLARWEFFLGDSACAPDVDELGHRQTIAQISAIEDHAVPGDVIVSGEMLQTLGNRAMAEMLPHSAARLTALRLQPEALACPCAQAAALNPQLPSHVAARAAALFRMHVVDNVRQRIEAGHYDFINEIRQLTILFMGFPSLKDADPKRAHQLHPVQDTVMAVSRVMSDFQGSFVQFRCDEKGFLAICAFGLPGVSHANNTARGILAALQMQAVLEGMGQRFACGITTGALLCACVGSKIRSEYTMFGDAINLSARLMCKAKAGLATIITDQPTMEKADTKAAYHPLEPLKLKGKENPAHVRIPSSLMWQPVHSAYVRHNACNSCHYKPCKAHVLHICIPSTALQVFSVHLLPGCDLANEAALATGALSSRRTSERVHQRMVGREAVLQVVRERARRVVRDNTSSLTMVAGPAGMGKTRLLQHLSSDEDFAGFKSDLRIFRAKGTQELRPVPLTPWRTIIIVRHSTSMPALQAVQRMQVVSFCTGTLSFQLHRCSLCPDVHDLRSKRPGLELSVKD